MKFKEYEFIPMLFGGDINTYSVARAFYEEYNVKSHVFGKYWRGPCYKSRIIEYTANPKITTDEAFFDTVKEFCTQHADKKILVIGCGDAYAALISKHKDLLPQNAIAPYIDFDFMNELQHKEFFYKLCEKYDIGYPGTFVVEKDMGLDFELPFGFPVILKASNSVTYWEECVFEGREKIYRIQNREELDEIITKIYNAGYPDSLIIQDIIPGNDEYMRILTCYSNKEGKVQMMCLGHTMLEEHTPIYEGNPAVIVTEPQEEILYKVKNLLEGIGYIGYSNFDIKYDTRDGEYKFFEINTRQGMSNYYVTASGFNVAKYFVEEYIYGNDLPFEIAKEEHLWMTVPKRVAREYIHEKQNLEQLNRLIREKKMVNPIFKKGDNKFERILRMLKFHFDQFGNFKKYYK